MNSPKAPREAAIDAVHTELLGRNLFVFAMIGAVGFVAACFLVTLQ